MLVSVRGVLPLPDVNRPLRGPYLGYDLSDPVIDLYVQLLDKHTQALTPDRQSILKEAALLYTELVQLKSLWLV